MKINNKNTGRHGEDIAAIFLQKKGYTILERNYANRFGEIDILARDKETLVFIEVKTKTGVEFGLPEEMISKGKLQRVRSMATIYMAGRGVRCRIDVIAIILNYDKQLVSLHHYQNVYY